VSEQVHDTLVSEDKVSVVSEQVHVFLDPEDKVSVVPLVPEDKVSVCPRSLLSLLSQPNPTDRPKTKNRGSSDPTYPFSTHGQVREQEN
jgi:hypothetical protein